MQKNEFEENYQTLGAVVLGEVLGAPYEGQIPGVGGFNDPKFGKPARLPATVDQWIDLVLKEPANHWRILEPGAYVYRTGDDTYFTLALAESLSEQPRFDGSLTAKYFYNALSDNEKWSAGFATLQAYKNLEQGLPWDECGSEQSAGNGTIMRFSPVPLCNQDTEWMIETSKSHSRITHKSPLAAFAVAGASLAFSALKENPEYKTAPMASYLLEHLSSHFPQAIEYLKKWEAVGDNIEDQWEWLSRLGVETQLKFVASSGELIAMENKEQIQIGRHNFFGGFAPTALLWSLSVALHFKNDYFSALHYACSKFGDTDTICAITGAFCSAYQISDPRFYTLLPRLDCHGKLTRVARALAEGPVRS